MHLSTIVLLAVGIGADPVSASPASNGSSERGRKHVAYRQFGEGWTTGSAQGGDYRRYADSGGQQTPAVGGRSEQSVLIAPQTAPNGRLIDRPNYAGGTSGSTSPTVPPPTLIVPPSSNPVTDGNSAALSQTNSAGSTAAPDPGRNPFANQDYNSAGQSMPVAYDRGQQQGAGYGSFDTGTNRRDWQTNNSSPANSGMVPVRRYDDGYLGGNNDSPRFGAGTAAPDYRNQSDANRRLSQPISDSRGPALTAGWDGGGQRDGGSNQSAPAPQRTSRDSSDVGSQAGLANGAGSSGQNSQGIESPAAQGQFPPNTSGVQVPEIGQTNETDADAPAEPPWIPLVLTAVFLMGSLGANFFLGFSYLDARHKYLTAVRRSSRSFSRGDLAA